jgi:hypothetical protein
MCQLDIPNRLVTVDTGPYIFFHLDKLDFIDYKQHRL